MLCYSKDGLFTSSPPLPSEALQTEAVKSIQGKVGAEPQAHRLSGWHPCPTSRLWPKQFCPPW